MFERDRGEMPVHRRKSKDQTYYAKKMLTYYEANRVGEHVRELGIPNFRVATVTTTPERVEQMIEAQKELTDGRGSNLFLFIDDAKPFEEQPARCALDDGEGERHPPDRLGMKEITKDQVREVLERVHEWPAERQANLIQVIELAEEEYTSGEFGD